MKPCINHAASSGKRGIVSPVLPWTVGVVKNQLDPVNFAEHTRFGHFNNPLDFGIRPIAKVCPDKAILFPSQIYNVTDLLSVAPNWALAEQGASRLQNREGMLNAGCCG